MNNTNMDTNTNNNKVLCCKIPTKNGELIRKILLEHNLLNKEYKLKKEGEYLYLPLNINNTNKLSCNILSILKKNCNNNIEFIEKNLFKNTKNNKLNFREYLISNFKKHINSNNISLSYDVIGHIVILQISDNINKEIKQLIGKKALELIPSIKSVYNRKSEVLGEYRVRELELIGGEDNPLTIYKENNYKLLVNVKEVYFSPRLGWERKRIMEKINENDVVVDMFCGVGPFVICCKKAKKIYAVDINPKAIELLKENLKLNKIENKVVIFNEDINKISVKGNKVIMNLPKFSHLFIEKALDIIENNGIIYYYCVGEDYNQCIELFKSKCKYNFEIMEKRIVKSYSPRKKIFVLDIKINK